MEKRFHHANSYWENYVINLKKSHQEIAGYSHNFDVQEAIDKTHQIIQDTFLSNFDTNAFVLDIGCGPGLYLRDFDKNVNLYGIDISSGMLELASKNVPHARLINAVFQTHSFNIKFDFIYSVGMLQYVHIDEIILFFVQAHSLLKPEGVLLISYPHAIDARDLDFPDINYINYSPKMLEDLASKYFQILQNKHIIDNREVGEYDINPYKPINESFDKTYRNSSVLILKKK